MGSLKNNRKKEFLKNRILADIIEQAVKDVPNNDNLAFMGALIWKYLHEILKELQYLNDTKT